MPLWKLRKPFLPGFATIIILNFKSLLQDLFLQTDTERKETSFTQVLLQHRAESSIHETLESYVIFLLMTLLFDVLLQGFTLFRRNSTPQGKSYECSPESMNLSRYQQPLFDKIKKTTTYLFKSLIRFSMMFCIYKVLCICSFMSFKAFSLGNQNIPIENQLQQVPSRILEEQLVFPTLADIDYRTLQKPSLSIGKVVSEIDIEVHSMKLSKDEKTAFVVTGLPATLKIIDISDLESPVILSSLPLVSGPYYKLFKSVIVSNYQDVLYISNVQYLEVIDISDLRSPVCMSVVEDHKVISKGQDFGALEISKPTLVISRDNRVLFVAGIGLQTFDLSRPTAPVLVNSTWSQAKLPASVALDGDKLFYTDGSLWIYNVSDPMNMKLMNCFNQTYPISSMILSKTGQSVFLLNTDKNRNITVHKVNISEDAQTIKVDRIVALGQQSEKFPIFLEQTPGDLFLFILGSQVDMGRKLYIFDTTEERSLSHNKLLIESGSSVIFTENYEKLLIGSQPNLKLANLYLNYPNKHAFTGASNILKSFETGLRYFSFEFVQLSQNEGIIYSLASGPEGKSIFEIQKITTMSNGEAQLMNIKRFETGKRIDQMVVSGDKARVFLMSLTQITILDISDVKNITLLGEYVDDDGDKIKSLVISQDGKTGYFMAGSFNDPSLDIVDFSEPQKPLKKSSLSLDLFLGSSSKLILSKDENTLFLIHSKLWVYDVSDAASPALLHNISVAKVDGFLERGVNEGQLSFDGNFLFIKEGSSQNYATVHIIDVSNIKERSPSMMSEFHYPFVTLDNYYSGRVLGFSPDSNTLYVLRNAHLMVVDVSNKTSPRFLGEVHVFNGTSKDMIMDFVLSGDGTTAYIPTSFAKLHLVSIQPSYSTFIKQETLKVGERHRQDIMVLKMGEDHDYNMMGVDYRFTKFALVESPSIQNANFEDVVLKMPPSWISFDLKSHTLTVEARRKNDIGMYRVYFGFSKQLEVNVFSTINDTLNSNDLMTTLISLGYVDNELFLTENFGKYKYFLLPSQYSEIREQVYGILKQYSFETFNELNVVKSLEIRKNRGKLKIYTANPSSLKVDIVLRPGQPKQAQFLSRYYGYLFPSITANKSRITLEGPMYEINLALQEAVVNLENITSCDGMIFVDDKLNPVVSESLKDITRFFNHNMPPGLSNNSIIGTLQSQIDKNPVWTGQYFQIKLNQHTFFDKHTLVENLNYQVVFMEKGEEAAALPNWVSLNGMDLIGTAPEEILNRDFEFKLVVKNEFREYKEPFTLHVKISTSLILKLLMKYSPYVLSIVGLLISANKIFNVIFKGSYKHPKDVDLRVGEEVTDGVIFPVSFIREEIQEAKRILEVVKKRIARECGVGSITKRQLVDYFKAEGKRKIDNVKVLRVIKESLNQLSEEKRQDFGIYLTGEQHPQKIINQIIMNTLTLDWLGLTEEKETKIYFEKVKKQWSRFIEWDSSAACFKICDDKFNKAAQNEDEETILTNIDERNSSFSESLMMVKSDINQELLRMAILAYAFSYQNINIFPEKVEVRVKEQKKKENFIKRFLKLDLKDATLNEKGKIGYGIRYTKEFNTLHFSGVVKPDIKDKTIVVQIANLRHKILKEIWIYGEKGNVRSKNDVDQLEAAGTSYQVL